MNLQQALSALSEVSGIQAATLAQFIATQISPTHGVAPRAVASFQRAAPEITWTDELEVEAELEAIQWQCTVSEMRENLKIVKISLMPGWDEESAARHVMGDERFEKEMPGWNQARFEAGRGLTVKDEKYIDAWNTYWIKLSGMAVPPRGTPEFRFAVRQGMKKDLANRKAFRSRQKLRRTPATPHFSGVVTQPTPVRPPESPTPASSVGRKPSAAPRRKVYVAPSGVIRVASDADPIGGQIADALDKVGGQS